MRLSAAVLFAKNTFFIIDNKNITLCRQFYAVNFSANYFVLFLPSLVNSCQQQLFPRNRRNTASSHINRPVWCHVNTKSIYSFPFLITTILITRGAFKTFGFNTWPCHCELLATVTSRFCTNPNGRKKRYNERKDFNGRKICPQSNKFDGNGINFRVSLASLSWLQ